MFEGQPQSQPVALDLALIIDDHPLFCDALAMTLKAVVGIARIDTADRLDAALARLGQGPAPDVIVLDLHLPDVEGLEGLLRLRQTAARVPVVVVSSMAEDRVITACMAAGAAAFVPKHSRREVFRAAFEALRSGETWLPEGYQPPGLCGLVSRQEDAIQRLSALTKQQARILQLICEGRLNKQIAWELSIAETTVKAHVTATMRKLGVQSRTQAVLLAKEASFAALVPEAG
ncbi:response regulator transcription factor [Xinfangfangia sp. CPCC 101601]|uniref:Response regulator transcription factor n=1 Tax=Pseudogemmobacter lacusdianii TaxID=3069608 RepID=A0ABU0VWM8_9RHOB|nr:response regulator transcription factor [Xinfangfangia sp. CPCC 101601]MDQ2065590.1 response regulator transcription factor [Xinfangfangia sp. CPCC 101601]